MAIKNFAKPLIIAHRGFKKKYPENTIAAFDAAIECGAEMIELDISLTKDRRPVVIHDETLDRTTSGTGRVNSFTLDELKSLDAGSWFSKKFKNEPLPDLEEILARYGCRLMINIEIKPEAFEKNNPDDAIEKQVLNLINRYSCIDSVLISSFSEELILRLNSFSNRPETALLTEAPADKRTIGFLKKAGCFSWNTDYMVLTETQVSMMHDDGLRVFAYTVNDIKTAEQLFKAGVDGIFTDDVETFAGKFR